MSFPCGMRLGFIIVSIRSTCEVLFGAPYGANEHCLRRSPQSLLRLKRNALRIRRKGQSLSTANTKLCWDGVPVSVPYVFL
jgi:hypothetical protein